MLVICSDCGRQVCPDCIDGECGAPGHCTCLYAIRHLGADGREER